MAPFDRILVTAGAPETVPAALIDQLADGGVLVVPAGSDDVKILWKIEKDGEILRKTNLMDCCFVPLIGRQGYPGIERE